MKDTNWNFKNNLENLYQTVLWYITFIIRKLMSKNIKGIILAGGSEQDYFQLPK